MILKKECLSYLASEKIKLIEEFPKYESITEALVMQITDFISTDFDGISENKTFRCFLNKLKDILYFAFDNNSSKAYMRSFFKILNKQSFIAYLTGLMKSKTADIKFIMNRFVNFFVYYEACDNTKNEIIKLIDGWM